MSGVGTMKARVIASLVLALVAIFVLLSGDWVVFAAVTVLNLLSVYELCKCFGFCKKQTWFVPLYMAVAVLLAEAASVSCIRSMMDACFFGMLLSLYLVLGFVLVLRHHKTGQVTEQAFFSLLAVSWVLVWFLSQAVNLRMELEQGKLLLWAVLVGACLTDTFALFTGKLFGRHPLAIHISPNKTIEGAVGGTVGAVLSMLIFGLVVRLIQSDFTVHYGAMALLGLLCALAAQIGDLSMSALKREAGIKDFSEIIPGHGGVLDRMDSIIFVAPAAYYFLRYISVLG